MTVDVRLALTVQPQRQAGRNSGLVSMMMMMVMVMIRLESQSEHLNVCA